MLDKIFGDEYQKSKTVQDFVKFVKLKSPNRNVATIKRDYYRLKRLIVKGNGQGLGTLAQLSENKKDVVGSEWLSSQKLDGISIIRQLKLKDMYRFKIKITERLLQSEGFTKEEIKKILGGEKDEETRTEDGI